MVARLTPDQKVACSNHVTVTIFYNCWTLHTAIKFCPVYICCGIFCSLHIL